MKRWQLIFAACALSTGCAGLKVAAPSPDPTLPQVTVVADRFIVVNQEPLVFLKDQRNVTIVWQLPKDSKYRFQERNGIDVERSAEGEIVECRTRSGGLEFSCVNRHTKFGKYRYTIRLTHGPGKLESDPSIYNE